MPAKVTWTTSPGLSWDASVAGSCTASPLSSLVIEKVTEGLSPAVADREANISNSTFWEALLLDLQLIEIRPFLLQFGRDFGLSLVVEAIEIARCFGDGLTRSHNSSDLVEPIGSVRCKRSLEIGLSRSDGYALVHECAYGCEFAFRCCYQAVGSFVFLFKDFDF